MEAAIAFWVPIVISIVTAIGMVITLKRQTNMDRADIAEKYENMATRQLARIEELESRVRELTEILEEWEIGLKILLCQMKENNLPPDWMPKKRLKDTSSKQEHKAAP